ncbi:MAG: terminase large subunit, partial [Finegoldia magna]|nr:terminase large subunit [Finegoldia magna]
MISTKYVDEYIGQYKSKKIILNKDRKDLIYYLENVVLVQDGFWFDEKQIDSFVKFTEKWFFKLKPFQKFLISFIFL